MTTDQNPDRRERYMAALLAADPYALVERRDDRARFADAVIALADAEHAELRKRHWDGLRRADEINNNLMEEVQRYAAGEERPVLWSVYNEMHKRALMAEAEVDRLRRLADEAQQPGTDRRVEPINCGLCLYGSDVGVPGYDDKGPAYINPACPDHNTEAMLGICICGHTQQQHFEDACLVCDCGDYLVPEAAREVIARWREAATRKPADQPAARSCPPDCPCHAVCIGTKQAATETQQDGAQP